MKKPLNSLANIEDIDFLHVDYLTENLDLLVF